MSKYVKLKDAVKELEEEWFYEPYTPRKLLKELPTIDIVTCKDCKHAGFRRIPARGQDIFYGCPYSAIEHDGDFYCSYGERKEE